MDTYEQRPLTPYDTGAVAEPKVWPEGSGDRNWGRVDFDNDESASVATVQVVKRPDGSYEVRVEVYDSDTVITRVE